MSKSVKTDVLAHWFGIDRILFGKPANKVLSEEDLEKYITTKSALLSNLFEIYKKIDMKSNTKFIKESDMVKKSIVHARDAKKRAKKLMENTSIIKSIKSEIKEIGNIEGLTESQVSRYVVLKRRNAIALDSMLFESYLNDNNVAKLNDWQGKVLIDASKTLRDALIDISLQ